MPENPNLLRKEILSTFDAAIVGGGSFQRRIVDLAVDFPISSSSDPKYSQNRHMFSHIIQELNRKLDKFGFPDQIVHPIDAGFRPLDGFYDGPGCFMRPRIIPLEGHGWGVKSLVSIYEFDGSTAPVDPKVMQVQRPGGGSSNIKDFKASEVEDGTLLSWVTENDANADGGVRILYDQGPQDPVRSSSFVYTDTYDFYQYYSVQQPKIVINGALSRDTEGKVALNGNGAKMQLGSNNGNETVKDFFSSNGTWSLFLVTDFQDYSTATNANVQVLHFTTSTNGGANSPRKPVIACNRNNNTLAIAQSTQTVGSNTLGNIFLPTYPGEQLLSCFGHPSARSNINNLGIINNEAFLDGVERGYEDIRFLGHAFTSKATAVNTETDGTSVGNVIFQPSEVGVTTFLSALVYSPTYEFYNKDRIERNLIEEFDITFV